jgi:hypothetical protein
MAIELSTQTFSNKADIIPRSGTKQIINNGIANTLDGNDIIIGTGGNTGIRNNATINTGEGGDTITAVGNNIGNGLDNGGTINTDVGNDRITGTGGNIGVRNDGTINTGEFNGGSGKDLLKLSTGNYTVGISGSTVSFTSNGLTMNTSEFDKLTAGYATYNFTGLTDGQTINVI